ncbi:hypothetical protein I6M70_17165 [Acinetobacter pittii]|uniref:DUF6283 family protein n=1 Tax=Acinetobacter pittii TaxID=48296 RepID=UPI001901EEE2|nr:DUF6283 family protein [Acinetobacter pittii]MBJ8481091.1 hypothetical protein [Acinetobacter pittii]
MELTLTRPCKDCPFKNDIDYQRGWLGKERAQGIIDTLYMKDQNFPCHKTTHKPRHKQQHCAGAMILLERSNRANQWMRINERLGIYDRNKLDMNTPVFDNPEQFISWHAGSEVLTEYQKRQNAAQAREDAKIALLEIEPKAGNLETAQWIGQKEDQMTSFLKNLEQNGIKRDSFGEG